MKFVRTTANIVKILELFFDVFLTVHHSIDFFQVTNLMHTSFILSVTLLIKHAPSLESNTTCCELVGNAGPAPVRLLSLHFLYIIS